MPSPALSASPMLVLSNIERLYDGTGSGPDSLHSNVDVLIENGLITAVRRHNPKTPIASNVSTVDCTGCAVTPGIIDCHNHATIIGSTEALFGRINGPDGLLYIERILYTSLVNGGVTTLRDMGGATHRLKNLIEDGVVLGPRLLISICMLSATAGHGDFRGTDRCFDSVSKVFPPVAGRPSSIVDGPWECRKRVREIVACGADFIKLCTSPGVHSASVEIERRDFTLQEIEAIVEEATAKGLRVAVHAHSRSGIEDAIRCGVQDIQHASFIDQALVERAAAAGCTITPTSWVIHETVQRAEALPLPIREKALAVASAHTNAVQMARRQGLPILAGTDAILTGMHGKNAMEMAHLISDGLTALEAWHGATGLAASCLGLGNLGVIAAGNAADLLVCSVEALDHPEKLVEGGLYEVIKEGYGYKGFPSIPQNSYAETVSRALSE